MKKNIDTRIKLFENMAKLNPDFNAVLDTSNLKKLVTEAEDKWIQKAVDPEHKGYCTPMTKSTCTPRRKALAKRFKKGIDENIEDYGNEENYQLMVDRIKKEIDNLIAKGEYEAIDVLYYFMVSKKGNFIHNLGKGQPIKEPVPIAEDASADPQKRIELLKGKIDFLYDNKHFDVIEKLNTILDKLFPVNEPETELAESKGN